MNLQGKIYGSYNERDAVIDAEHVEGHDEPGVRWGGEGIGEWKMAEEGGEERVPASGSGGGSEGFIGTHMSEQGMLPSRGADADADEETAPTGRDFETCPAFGVISSADGMVHARIRLVPRPVGENAPELNSTRSRATGAAGGQDVHVGEASRPVVIGKTEEEEEEEEKDLLDEGIMWEPVPVRVGGNQGPVAALCGQPSPDAVGGRSSPDAVGGRPSPDAVGGRSSPDAVGGRSSPDGIYREGLALADHNEFFEGAPSDRTWGTPAGAVAVAMLESDAATFWCVLQTPMPFQNDVLDALIRLEDQD